MNGRAWRLKRLLRWLFFDGNRLVITGGVTVGVFLLTWGLVSAGVITVGPRSSVKTTFGSGVVAGLITVITISLTINQLIATRVFGSPDALRRQFEGGTEVRRSVERIAGEETVPVSMTGFISLIGSSLRARAGAFKEKTGRAGEGNEELAGFVSSVEDYAERIESVTEEMRPVSVIATTGGSDYARHFRDAQELAEARSDRLAESARDDLDAIVDLLRALSISRQYYKTIVLQQELAQLSRFLIYVGLPATLVAIYVPLVYRSGAETVIPSGYLPVVVSGAIAVVLMPLVLLLAHLLRITTVMRYTVSVAPFAPPAEWPWSE